MTFQDSDPLGEFAVIKRFFASPKGGSLASSTTALPSKIILGIGDDCALVKPPNNGEVLAMTSDMLVAGRHFFEDISPALLGHKSLAVNLSDLAAMGARPIAYSLSIALPEVNSAWLSAFSGGLHALAHTYHCPLIGGDTTAGPLTIAITAIGAVDPAQALRRDRAMIGDDIWVSHTVGDARLVLGFRRGEWQMAVPWQSLTNRMDAPTPRIDLGLGLRGLAHSAIDVSDGLLGDLSHILEASQVRATVWVDAIPCSPFLQEFSVELRRLCTLQGGDDYELCFTAPKAQRTQIQALGKNIHLKLTRIGEITADNATSQRLTLLDQAQVELPSELTAQYVRSFDHFQ